MKKEIVKKQKDEMLIVDGYIVKNVLFIDNDILKVRVIREELVDCEIEDIPNAEYITTIQETELYDITEYENCYDVQFYNPFWNVEIRHVLVKKVEIKDEKILKFLKTKKIK